MNNKDKNTDLPDSEKDSEKLKPEITSMDLPEVSDIPGQENIKPAPLGELADTTISSADEEADHLFNDNVLDNDSTASDISARELEDLESSAITTTSKDDVNLKRAALDSLDDDGDPLNEESFKHNISASGLDVPGASDDDENEDIGEEDEENNEYSLGGDNHD